AVADMPADVRIAQRISGRSEDEVFSAIDAGLRWRLLKDATGEMPGIFSFSHDLMRQSIHRQLNTVRRQQLHQRSALALDEMGAPDAQIAYHWHEAGNIDRERIHAIRAGDRAMDLHSYREGIIFINVRLKLSHSRASVPP
ncbi:MAG: hypothetical protein AAFQ07_07415, partial [Chloroflexota bacterium]